jgi:hypothetical protein
MISFIKGTYRVFVIVAFEHQEGVTFTLSVNNMKQIVDQLKSSIQTNEVMRLKHPDNPEK